MQEKLAFVRPQISEISRDSEKDCKVPSSSTLPLEESFDIQND